MMFTEGQGIGYEEPPEGDGFGCLLWALVFLFVLPMAAIYAIDQALPQGDR